MAKVTGSVAIQAAKGGDHFLRLRVEIQPEAQGEEDNLARFLVGDEFHHDHGMFWVESNIDEAEPHPALPPPPSVPVETLVAAPDPEPEPTPSEVASALSQIESSEPEQLPPTAAPEGA